MSERIKVRFANANRSFGLQTFDRRRLKRRIKVLEHLTGCGCWPAKREKVIFYDKRHTMKPSFFTAIIEFLCSSNRPFFS